MTQSLGEVWEGDGLSLKPYPCFRPSHAAIDAAIALHRELQLGSQTIEIASVIIETDEGSWRDQLAPGTTRRRPAHVIEAQFATPFLVATALVKGRVTIDDVAEVTNATVLTLADSIDGRPVAGKERGWARLVVTLTNGRSAAHEVANPSGSPAAPIDDDALNAKFRDCARHAIAPLSDLTVTSAIAAIRTLPNAIDVRQIFATLPMR
ncbi:MAG: hypothetical protein AB7U78_10505 [Hyphomicrobiaceae bacterium]